MNRKDEMNQFIKQVVDLINRHNSTDFFVVYEALADYGFSKDELSNNHNLMYMFDDWIAYFKGNPNLNVYHTKEQRFFLQFSNSDDVNSVKLYFSLGAGSLNAGVKMVFDYIAKNNYKTISKVAYRIRSDSIVLRMNNPEDAASVIDFINSNDFLVKNAHLTNPFLARNGVVGIGYDDFLSYNEVVSYFLYEYIIENGSSYENCNVDDFLAYLIKKYNDIFINKTEFDSFVHSDIFEKNCQRIENCFSDSFNYTIENFQKVFSVLINNVNSDDYSIVYDIVNKARNSEIVNCSELLSDFVKYAYSKYGDSSRVVKILEEFIKGDSLVITRDLSFRKLFCLNMDGKKILELTSNNISEYVSNLISFNTITSQNDFDVFLLALKGTYKKYGPYQLRDSFFDLLAGDIDFLTNDDGCRSYLKHKYSKGELKDLVSKYIYYILNNSSYDFNGSVEERFVDILVNVYDFGARVK